MTRKEYLNLPRADGRAHDAEVKAALTAEPKYIPEWDEYAAIDAQGRPVYGATAAACLARLSDANDLIARHAEREARHSLETA